MNLQSSPYCIVVNNQNGTTVIGPFENAQAAARYAGRELEKPVGQTAVILPMRKP